MITLYPFERSSDWPKTMIVMKVHSVYSKAINFEGENNRRYSLITGEPDYLPRAALIEALPFLKAGETVKISPELSSVGFDPSIDPGSESVNPLWQPLWREWKRFLLDDRLDCLLDHLENPEEMLGLGPGTTPAGDDFITGLVTAFRWSGVEVNERLVKALEKNGTTWFSAQMIRDALNGYIWKRGKKLCQALTGSSASELLSAAGRILQWGHLSGRAWLAGFSTGLEGIS
ncbi:MAG: DUF2877 domain-containing protein [Thermotogaceae bacterium]|jgi:hypothetical protein|nr:DUF2877 domain-containing protein [Mesotoga sp.]NLX33114.1 DUF2877 domain-containing protein [Thermotogaceae bacterium]HOI63065.1 DUF2877 domain-containing protein [Mesotoga sp.]HOY25489.1 DUF2877 domain-containing protein [Mesotoga sp.]HPB62801.1 DUF2877 domain-containing protein [Mesotoga sp.]